MILTDFYKIIQTIENDSGTMFYIALNPNHSIYSSHFPGQPVLPGVCTLQIIKECAEQLTDKKLQYKKILQCKFLRFIDPTQNNKLTLKISLKDMENDEIQLTANGITDEFDFIKTKAIMGIKEQLPMNNE